MRFELAFFILTLATIMAMANVDYDKDKDNLFAVYKNGDYYSSLLIFLLAPFSFSQEIFNFAITWLVYVIPAFIISLYGFWFAALFYIISPIPAIFDTPVAQFFATLLIYLAIRSNRLDRTIIFCFFALFMHRYAFVMVFLALVAMYIASRKNAHLVAYLLIPLYLAAPLFDSSFYGSFFLGVTYHPIYHYSLFLGCIAIIYLMKKNVKYQILLSLMLAVIIIVSLIGIAPQHFGREMLSVWLLAFMFAVER